MFFVEHNIVFHVADHLMDIIKSFDSNSAVLQKMRGDHTKLVNLINGVVGQQAFHQLIDHLKENNFSIMMDESTDVGTVKNLVITVRHLLENCIVDDFLALLEVK